MTARVGSVVKPHERLVVGLSGGVDSMVLLDCVQRIARKLRVRVSALHVNHQLSPNAARWSAFCRRACLARGVPFRSVKVTVARGESLEAAARAARYAVFRAQAADYVVLAQHQDDQVETLLLQLLRGAGLKGLAAMPFVRIQDSGFRIQGETHGRKLKKSPSPETRGPSPAVLRPFLDVTRAEIKAYAKARGLDWIEDESNEDTYFKRNFLRRKVLPVIARSFPAYRRTVARAAHHLAEASQLLDEVAANDGSAHLSGATLAVEALRKLSAPRARNLLRYFLASHGVAMPGAEQLGEALRQALTAKQDARVVIELGRASLGRFDGRLYVVPRPGPLRRDYEKRWRGERELKLPELGGVLEMARASGAGVSLARLRGQPVTVRLRRGGERLQPDCGRPRRSLKNLLQEARVPPWQRERLPLIVCGGDLVWAPGIGVDCAFQASGDEPALRPVWKPFI